MRLTENLRTRFLDVQEQLRSITDTIAEREDSEPDEAEAANLAALNAELEALTPRIAHATTMERSLSATAEMLGAVAGDTDERIAALRRVPDRLDTFRSFGEYAQAIANGTVAADVREEYRRALVDMTTAEAPGIVPPSYLTDIVDLIGTARPFIDAFSTIALPPTGMTVNYPSVTTRPTVGKQAAQKGDVTSSKSLIEQKVASVDTYGGGEDVSVQLIQRSDPAYLQLMFELYGEELAIAMDKAAIAAATAAVTQVQPIGPGVTGANTALAAAAADIFAAGATPEVLVVGLDLWTFFAGASDADGRPLFTNVNGFNPVGTLSLGAPDGTARGLAMFLDVNLPPDNGFMGWRRAFTSMLGGIQTLSADNPSKLGVDYAIFEMAAFAARRPKAMVRIVYTATVAAGASSGGGK